MTLEEILQKYFACPVPFRLDGDLTTSGTKAFQSLESLLDDLTVIGVIEQDSDYRRQLYEILDES